VTARHGFSVRAFLLQAHKEVSLDFAILKQLSLFGKLGLVVSVLPLVAGILYAIRPNERGLAMMRPLSLAGIFASISNLLLGLANGLYSLGRVSPGGQTGYQLAGPILAEVLIPSFIGFASLTVAWLCVAIGTRKSG
jgi:hypothetical protein